MIKVQKVFAVVLLLILSLVTVRAQQRINPRPQSVVQFNWAGTYTAETYAGRTYSGLGIVFETEIKLTQSKKSKDDYYGSLTVEGYQTYKTANIVAEANGRHITVYFIKEKEESNLNSFEYHKYDIVAEFTYTKDRGLKAEWFGEIRDDFINDETTFKKKK